MEDVDCAEGAGNGIDVSDRKLVKHDAGASDARGVATAVICELIAARRTEAQGIAELSSEFGFGEKWGRKSIALLSRCLTLYVVWSRVSTPSRNELISRSGEIRENNEIDKRLSNSLNRRDTLAAPWRERCTIPTQTPPPPTPRQKVSPNSTTPIPPLHPAPAYSCTT